MHRICARLGQDADMSAAIISLGGVVLRGVDRDLLNGVRGRSGKSLANGPIHRGTGLDRTTRTEVLTGVEHKAVLAYLTGGIAIKDVVGADSVQGKAVAGVPVSVSEDGLIAKPGVGAPATKKICVYARAENCQLREAARAQRGGFDRLSIDNIAD